MHETLYHFWTVYIVSTLWISLLYNFLIMLVFLNHFLVMWYMWFSAIRQYFSTFCAFNCRYLDPILGSECESGSRRQNYWESAVSAFHSHISRLPLPRIICTTVFGDTNIVKAREQSSIQIREREKRNIIHICCLLRENWTNMNVNISEQRTNIPSKIFPTYLHILCFKTTVDHIGVFRQVRAFIPDHAMRELFVLHVRAIRPACESYSSCMREIFLAAYESYFQLHTRAISSFIWEIFLAAYESYF